MELGQIDKSVLQQRHERNSIIGIDDKSPGLNEMQVPFQNSDLASIQPLINAKFDIDVNTSIKGERKSLFYKKPKSIAADYGPTSRQTVLVQRLFTRTKSPVSSSSARHLLENSKLKNTNNTESEITTITRPHTGKLLSY